MMKRRVMVLAAAAGAMVVLAGCGGEGEATSTPVDPEEDAIAEAVLLRLTDFPTGWAETPPDDEEDDTFDECAADESPMTTARAETGNFGRGGGDSVSQMVAVFPTAADANSAADLARSIVECVAEKLNAGEADDDEVEVVEATFAEVSFPALAERTYAYRIAMELRVDGGDGTIGAYLDLVYMVGGRVVSVLIAQGVLSPFEPSMLEGLAGVVEERLANTEAGAAAND